MVTRDREVNEEKEKEKEHGRGQERDGYYYYYEMHYVESRQHFEAAAYVPPCLEK